MSPANTNNLHSLEWSALVRFLNSGEKPKTFREWLVWRIQRSPSQQLSGERAELPPQYLKLWQGPELDPDRRSLERLIMGELRAMRDEGLIASINKRWYLRPRPTRKGKRA